MKERELLETESGFKIIRPTFQERMQVRFLANKFGFALFMSAGVITGVQIPKEALERVKGYLDAAKGELKIDQEFRKGILKGKITKIKENEPISNLTETEELASYCRTGRVRFHPQSPKIS